MLTVQDVEAVQLANSDDKPLGVGTVLKVKGLSRDEDSGQVAKAFDVLDFASAQGDKPAWVSLAGVPFELSARDRIAFFHPTLGLKDLVVRSASREGDLSKIEFEQALGDRFSKEWMAMPTARKQRMAIPLAIMAVLGIAGCLGLLHGLLVTRVHLQPFVVTLCGLLIYRGISRWLVDDNPVGFGIEYKENSQSSWVREAVVARVGNGRWNAQTFGIPVSALSCSLAAAIVAAVFP